MINNFFISLQCIITLSHHSFDKCSSSTLLINRNFNKSYFKDKGFCELIFFLLYLIKVWV